MKTHEEKPDGREAYLLYGGSHCASAPAGEFPRSSAYDSRGWVSNAHLFPLYISEAWAAICTTQLTAYAHHIPWFSPSTTWPIRAPSAFSGFL